MPWKHARSISRRMNSPVARGVASSRSATSSRRCGELDAVGARLSDEIGTPYSPHTAGELVAGTFRRRLTLSSGRFAVIDNGPGFTLVPWTPALDRYLGHHVAGAPRRAAGSSGVSDGSAGWRSRVKTLESKRVTAWGHRQPAMALSRMAGLQKSLGNPAATARCPPRHA
jgi:hypothetical protein